MSKANPKEPTGIRDIYWIDVVERDYNSLNDAKVIQSYPFPDVPVWEELLPADVINRVNLQQVTRSLNDFVRQVSLIADDRVRQCTEYRFHFIQNVWHPTNFLRVSIKNWKYG